MTGDSSEAEVWLHLIKPITAGLIDAPRLKLMRRLRDGAAPRCASAWFEDAIQALKSASFDAIFECRRTGN
jgi:hypothetical protein